MHFPRKFALCKSCLNFEHQRTLLSCSAMQCTHCTQEFHTLLIYVHIEIDNKKMDLKHALYIEIKEKKGTFLSEL